MAPWPALRPKSRQTQSALERLQAVGTQSGASWETNRPFVVGIRMSNERASLLRESKLRSFLGWAQLRETPNGSRPPPQPAPPPRATSLFRRVYAPPVAARPGLGWPRAFAALGAAALALPLGCTGNPNPPPPCGAPTPAFRFHTTAVQTPLPDGLTLRVEFGGAQSETYEVGTAAVGEVACCVTVADVGDAPAHIPCGTTIESDATVASNAIVCDLWTNGAVNLSVSVGNDVLVEQTLHAKLLDEKSDCGQFDTLDAKWVLGESDAGVAVDGY